MKHRITAVLGVAVLVYVTAGFSCSFSTANISELKFGKTEKAEPASTTFNTGESIYAVATVSNASGKHKLNWKITYDNVPGKGKGEEVGSKSIDFDGSNQLWQQFSSPLPGDYKVEATLTDEEGKKLDSKTGTVTIKGAAPAAAEDKKKDDDDDDK